MATTVSTQGAGSPACPNRATSTHLIALLGKLETPTDGLEDYCYWLGRALRKSGWELECLQFPWPQGWFSALGWLWRHSRDWRRRWVLVQYTAFSWSRYGFTLGLLAALWILRRHGARCAVVLHDPGPCSGTRWVDSLRRAVQVPVLRAAYRWSERSIFTIDLSKITWLTGNHDRAVFIPVGANLPGNGSLSPPRSVRHDRPKEVAVYCVTAGMHAQREVEAIAHAVARAAEQVGPVRLVVLGRNAQAAEAPLRAALAGTGVELEIQGVLPAEAVESRLTQADVLLFVRGGISSRRGSAIAGIACGLPVVAYSWRETGPPVTEAGVVLVPSGDREALANALSRVLVDDGYRAQLRCLSMAAREKHFSWEAIAGRFVQALADCSCDKPHPRA